jgi:hypothetical protein
MADVRVNLDAEGDLEAEARAASKAMAELAAQEKRVGDVARKLGDDDLKRVSKALLHIDKESQRAGREAEAQIKRHAEGRRRALDASDKLLKGDVKGVAELNLAAGAAVALGAAFAAAVVAAVSLTSAIAKAALEAGAGKKSAEAMFRVLEGSNAEKALSAVDAASRKMGVSIEKGRERFIKFRQAGADNSVSVALSRLTADLDAIDPSGKLAEEAVEKVLSLKNKDGTANLEAMRSTMGQLAKEADVAGDGMTAVNAAATTTAGALARIGNVKTGVLEDLATRIGPTIDRVMTRAATALEEFFASAEGQEAINDISAAVDALASAADTLIPFIGDAIGAVAKFVRLGAEIAAGITLVPAAFDALRDSITEVLQDFFGLSDGVTDAVRRVVGAIMDPLGILSDGMPAVAFDIISGLIGGLNPARLAGHMKNLASSALSSFKSALGIASPSKAFKVVGGDMGDGTTIGFERALQPLPGLASGAVNDVANAIDAAPVSAPTLAAIDAAPVSAPTLAAIAGAPQGDFAPAPIVSAPQGDFTAPSAGAASGAGAGAASIGDITINVNGAGDPAVVALNVRRELQALLSAERLAKGAA